MGSKSTKPEIARMNYEDISDADKETFVKYVKNYIENKFYIELNLDTYFNCEGKRYNIRIPAQVMIDIVQKYYPHDFAANMHGPSTLCIIRVYHKNEFKEIK